MSTRSKDTAATKEKIQVIQSMYCDAIYVRQSVERVDSISIESQLEYCKYETRGNPYKEYIDKGFSGKNTNRPAFEEMIEDISET